MPVTLAQIRSKTRAVCIAALAFHFALSPAVAQPKPSPTFSSKEIQSLWQTLSSTQYARADSAYRQLVHGGSAVVPFLNKKIRTVAIPPVDVKHLHRLTLQLDSKKFAVRQKAAKELAKHGELSVVPLQKLLQSKPTLEARRRALNLLETVQVPKFTVERVRAMEGIQILEAIGTSAARKALAELSRDALIPLLRFQATQAVGRLTKRNDRP